MNHYNAVVKASKRKEMGMVCVFAAGFRDFLLLFYSPEGGVYAPLKMNNYFLLVAA